MTVSKLDTLKKALSLPISCPKCGGAMKDNNSNRKMWSIHKMCLDCVVKMESELKRLGKYEEYVANIGNQNKNAQLDDLEAALEQWVDEKETFVSEMGEVQKWGGGSKNAIYKQVKEEIARLRKQDIYNGQNTDEDAV